MNPVQFYKCLADETRLVSLLLIQKHEELCVCELMAAVDESQPKVSRHLAQLKLSGLLQDRRQGQWIFYRLHAQLPEWISTVLQVTAEAHVDILRMAQTKLETMGERPERFIECC